MAWQRGGKRGGEERVAQSRAEQSRSRIFITVTNQNRNTLKTLFICVHFGSWIFRQGVYIKITLKGKRFRL